MFDYKEEFPDFDFEIEVPEGFEDASWRNDTCPSFKNLALGLSLYVDYANPALREFPEDSRQFSLYRTDEIGARIDDGEDLVYTDDWQEVLDRLAEIASEPEHIRRANIVKQAKSVGLRHEGEYVDKAWTYFWSGEIDGRPVRIGAPDLSTAFPAPGDKWAMTVVFPDSGHQVGIEVEDFQAAVKAARTAVAQLESASSPKH